MSAGVRCLLFLAVVAVPLRAAAWTDARARSADVVVELDETGWAWVSFDVALSVRGGWLEGYEISGLDPDATLDPLKPPVLVGEQGEKWSPRARMREGGRLGLSFARRGAPRRGEYRLRFAYRTRLMPRSGERTSEGATRVRWTLPAWRTGLDAVQVWFWAPAGDALSVSLNEDADPVGARSLGRHTLLHFHRLHLPRATPWTVAIEMPSGRGPVSPSASARTTTWRGLVSRPDWAGASLVALCLAAMAFLQRRRARLRDVKLVHVLGSRPRALGCAAACVAAASVLTGPARWAALSLAVACTVAVRARTRGPLQFGAWCRIGEAERRATFLSLLRETLGATRYPDPLSLLGLAACATLGAWSVWGTAGPRLALPWTAACFAMACSFSSVRLGSATTLPLLAVFRLASRLRVSGVSLAVRAFFCGGAPRQPRLSVLLRAPISGLLRLEVSPQSWGGAERYAVLATVRSSSAADRWLSELDSHRVESPGRQRACHLWTARDVSDVEQRLGELMARCSERSHHVVSRAA